MASKKQLADMIWRLEWRLEKLELQVDALDNGFVEDALKQEKLPDFTMRCYACGQEVE